MCKRHVYFFIISQRNVFLILWIIKGTECHLHVYVGFNNLCRWKRNSSGAVITKDGKPVLEFVAVKRKDCDEWAIPGVRA